jgi:putative redox protein
MDAKVTWQKELQFTGIADGGFAVQMDSHPTAETGVSPVEMVALSLAGCTAMDVISILGKQRQQVSSFDVRIHAERATDYPKVITSAIMEYVVVGHDIQETALLTAIDRSIQKYCPVHAMLKRAFPIDVRYSIYEDGVDGQQPGLIKQGTYAD